MQYYGVQAMNAQIPREGPRAAGVVVPFDSDNHEFEIPLLLMMAQLRMSLVASIHIDNSANDNAVTVFANVINQALTIPAFFQAYLPFLVPKNATITASSDGDVSVPLKFINVPIPASVWLTE